MTRQRFDEDLNVAAVDGTRTGRSETILTGVVYWPGLARGFVPWRQQRQG